MSALLFLPPVTFLLVLILCWLQYRSLAILSAGESWKSGEGKTRPYACGEDIQEHRVQPDYQQFFSFAFFFTIMHVAALLVATVPPAQADAAVFAVIYLASAAVGLFVLFRR